MKYGYNETSGKRIITTNSRFAICTPACSDFPECLLGCCSCKALQHAMTLKMIFSGAVSAYAVIHERPLENMTTQCKLFYFSQSDEPPYPPADFDFPIGNCLFLSTIDLYRLSCPPPGTPGGLSALSAFLGTHGATQTCELTDITFDADNSFCRLGPGGISLVWHAKTISSSFADPPGSGCPCGEDQDVTVTISNAGYETHPSICGCEETDEEIITEYNIAISGITGDISDINGTHLVTYNEGCLCFFQNETPVTTDAGEIWIQLFFEGDTLKVILRDECNIIVEYTSNPLATPIDCSALNETLPNITMKKSGYGNFGSSTVVVTAA